MFLCGRASLGIDERTLGLGWTCWVHELSDRWARQRLVAAQWRYSLDTILPSKPFCQIARIQGLTEVGGTAVVDGLCPPRARGKLERGVAGLLPYV